MPDVFLTSLSRPVVESLGIEGIFIPLEGLIDEYGYNIKKLFEHNETVRPKLTAYDGHIYFLSKYWEGVHDRHVEKMWMNMKWLNNAGMDIPETTEDFYNVLKAFKEKDANENGDPNDEIPFIANTGWMSSIPNYLMNAFVYYTPSAYVEDGKVKVSYAQEGWREGLRFYKRLYDEELLDNECFSMTEEQAKALASAPTGNRVGCTVSGAISIFDFSDPELLNYKTIPPLTGPDGLKQAPQYNWNPSPYFAITSVCENPQAAIRWADCQIKDIVPDLQNDDFDWYTLWYGTEGVSWERAEKGEIGLSGEPAKYRWLFSWNEQTNDHLFEGFLLNENVGLKGMMARVKEGYDQEATLYEETIKNYNPYAVDKTIPSMSLKPDENERIAQLSTELSTYYQEMMAKFIRGEADLDNDWDDYLGELEAIGLEEYLKIYQEAYDRYLSTMKK
jgi:putative aldouronate transport system substrate-binding protein